jgi:hypothetical protein
LCGETGSTAGHGAIAIEGMTKGKTSKENTNISET